MNAIANTLVARKTLPHGGLFLRAIGILAVVVLAMFFGAVASIGSIKVAVLLGGALMALFLLAVPVEPLVHGLFVLSFFLVGQLFYFANMGQAVWIAFGAGGLFYLKWLIVDWGRGRGQRMDGIVITVAAFMLAFVISVAVNTPPVLQALAGGKNLILLWSVFLLIAAGLMSWGGLRKVWLTLEFALYFQVPIVLYQYLVVAPSRTRFGTTVGGVEWDAVVGGFGGDPLGGGYSGGMAYFVCAMAVYAIAMYSRRLIGRLRLVAMLLSSLICIALGEVKVVVVLLPVAAIVILAPQLRRRPLLFILGLPTVLVMGFGVLMAYERLHYDNKVSHARTEAPMIERAFNSLDPERINFRTGEMGRVAALIHWWNEALIDDPLHGLLGYGPGASRGNSIVGPGEIARRYPFSIDRSAATQILWDMGLFGFVAYVMGMVLAAFRALALSRSAERGSWESGVMETVAASLGMFSVMVLYGREPLEAPAIALFYMLLIGMTVFRSRLTASLIAPTPPKFGRGRFV